MSWPADGAAAPRNSASPTARATKASQVRRSGRRWKTTPPDHQGEQQLGGHQRLDHGQAPHRQRGPLQHRRQGEQCRTAHPVRVAHQPQQRAHHRVDGARPLLILRRGRRAAVTDAAALDSAANRARTTVRTLTAARSRSSRSHPNRAASRPVQPGAAPRTRHGSRSQPGT